MSDSKISLDFYERLTPTCTLEKNNFSIKFYTPTVNIKALVDTMFVAEPETIEWIGEFKQGEIFLDVGANIGLYSLWATVSKGVRCFSFEPESLNFSILNRNIFYNNLVEKVTAYPLAVSDQVGFDFLHLSVFESGESCHSFASNKNFAHQEFAPAFSQGSFSTTIDHLVETSVIPTPNHIKIDVDGIENKIINGARKILERPELKTLLIEINDDLPCDSEVKEILKDLGFILTSAPPSVLAPVKSVHNIICRR